MFEYVKVYDKHYNVDYGYVLKVDSKRSLFDVMMCVNNVSDRLIDSVIDRAFMMTPKQFMDKSKEEALAEFGTLYFQNKGSWFIKTEETNEYSGPIFTDYIHDIREDKKQTLKI